MKHPDTTIVVQAHVHSKRSHDSKIPIQDYVKYFDSKLHDHELGILGITDHNCLPVTTREALSFSTRKVIVVPGIQWKLHKSLKEAWRRRATRREILTLGNHDGLREFLSKRWSIRIRQKNEEIADHLTEEQLLEYLDHMDGLTLIVPHPSHGFVDYYGPKQIERLYRKVKLLKTKINFLVEIATGYDPFPRILYNYSKHYPVIANSDAHEIISSVGTDSFFSAYSTLIAKDGEFEMWKKNYNHKDIAAYRELLNKIGKLLIKENSRIVLKKSFLKSTIHFANSLPAWVRRRFQDFPRNLTK